MVTPAQPGPSSAVMDYALIPTGRDDEQKQKNYFPFALLIMYSIQIKFRCGFGRSLGSISKSQVQEYVNLAVRFLWISSPSFSPRVSPCGSLLSLVFPFLKGDISTARSTRFTAESKNQEAGRRVVALQGSFRRIKLFVSYRCCSCGMMSPFLTYKTSVLSVIDRNFTSYCPLTSIHVEREVFRSGIAQDF